MKENGKVMIKTALKVFGAFWITLGTLVGLLYLTAQIPKTVFRENLLESARYLEENESEFYRLKEEDRRTEIHNYADAITLNIMYSIDGETLWDELMTAPFYSDMGNKEYPMIELLKERIEEEKQADTIYDRYWHGMMILLRPLFCIFQITQIRVLMMLVLVGALLVFCIQLWKRGIRTGAVGLVTAGILTSYPMNATCMEYAPVWLIMLGSLFAALKCYKKWENIAVLSVVSGVCCAFFDFLTTETVAFVVPMAFLLMLREQEGMRNSFCQGLKRIVGCGTIWGFSYLGTLLTKWVLSGMVLGQERISTALYMMFYRQGAESVMIEADRIFTETDYLQKIESGNVYSQPITAFLTNLRLMLGLSERISLDGMLAGVFVVTFILLCIIYLFRKKRTECTLSIWLFLLGSVPILRIMILHNHSLEHCFFVYRSLFATVVCMIVGMMEIIDWNMVKKVFGRRLKNGKRRI